MVFVNAGVLAARAGTQGGDRWRFAHHSAGRQQPRNRRARRGSWRRRGPVSYTHLTLPTICSV
eukprot:8539708-Alexandrium_andersonii.AAC.1